MRILHVLPSRSPSYGGPVRVADQLATVAASEGHKVKVLPMAERSPLSLGGTLIYRLSWADIAALRPSVTEADVVHVHGLWNIPGTAASVTSTLVGRPYVVTPHGMLARWSLRQSRLRKRVYSRLFERRNLRLASALHFLNQSEHEEALEFGLETPGFVIPNGVDSALLRLERSRVGLSALVPETSDKVVVLFLGRLHHKKGLDGLIAAFASALRIEPDLHLLIAGPDESGYGAQIRRMIRRHSLGASTSVIGEVLGADKEAVLAGSDVFALTSREEADPVAVKEAMAAGLPVVITPSCRLPEVEEEAAGLVVGPETGPVAQALIRLSADSALRHALGQSGRRLIQSRYTAETIGRRMLACYEQIIRESTGSLGPPET